MDYIDPDSPHRIGHDCNGHVVVLGDTDSDGYFVGYIDETGHCWESRRERDTAIGSGRLFDAWQRWNKTGGVLGSPPDIDAILEAHDVLEEHRDEAVEDYREYVEMGIVAIPYVRAIASQN